MTVDIQELAFSPASFRPSALIRYALESKAGIEQLERLYALQLKWDADQAMKAYVSDMTAAKVDTQRIFEERHVTFPTRTGTTGYYDATIGNVVTTVVGWLAKFGFSHRWSMRQEGGLIYVTCVMMHAEGHSETCELSAAPDDSGGKNSIQAIASTKTHLERHTLLAVTGLATSEHDDDARAAGGTGVSSEETTIRSL